MINNYISIFLVFVGIIGLFRPALLIYALVGLPVLWCAPYLNAAVAGITVLKIGSITIYDLDYLFGLLILAIFFIFFQNFFLNRKSFYKYIASPISKIVTFFFIWKIFIGILSYIQGFHFENILRKLSSEALLSIAIFLPMIKTIRMEKEKFFDYVIFLCILMTIFAFFKFFISREIEYTSSGTVRTLLGNNVVLYMMPVCYLLFYKQRDFNSKILFWSLIVFLLLGINFTGHRSGWITFAFALVLYFLSSEFSLKDYIWIPLLGLSTILFISFFVVSNLKLEANKSIIQDMLIRISDTVDIENHTTQARLSRWVDSYEAFLEKPLIGYGRLPIYTKSLSENSKLENSFSEFDLPPHNLFADAIAHEGILGFSAIVIFLMVIFIQIIYLKQYFPEYSTFISVYILSFLLFSFFNTTFSAPSGKLYLAVILGFLNAESIEVRIHTQIHPVY